MSVIFGIKENGRIVLASDKRGSTKDGSFLNDNMSKIVVVNDHLAFASAGNAVFGTAISMALHDTSSKMVLSVDALAGIIRSVYHKILESKVLDTLKMPSTFSFIIAGKNQVGGASLLAGGAPNGIWELNEVEMILYPPDIRDLKQCCDIFVKNYKLYHADFAERTVHEISNISQIVSPTGDKWIYDTSVGKGIFYSF
jgi:hypothetical protein